MKHKFGLGERVSFDRRYAKLGFINTYHDDPGVVWNEESGRYSVPRWSEIALPKPRKGIVIGVRTITLAVWADLVEDGGEYEHWETVGKHLIGQAYVVATDMSHTSKVAESWMTAIGEKKC